MADWCFFRGVLKKKKINSNCFKWEVTVQVQCQLLISNHVLIHLHLPMKLFWQALKLTLQCECKRTDYENMLILESVISWYELSTNSLYWNECWFTFTFKEIFTPDLDSQNRGHIVFIYLYILFHKIINDTWSHISSRGVNCATKFASPCHYKCWHISSGYDGAK